MGILDWLFPPTTTETTDHLEATTEFVDSVVTSKFLPVPFPAPTIISEDAQRLGTDLGTGLANQPEKFEPESSSTNTAGPAPGWPPKINVKGVSTSVPEVVCNQQGTPGKKEEDIMQKELEDRECLSKEEMLQVEKERSQKDEERFAKQKPNQVPKAGQQHPSSNHIMPATGFSKVNVNLLDGTKVDVSTTTKGPPGNLSITGLSVNNGSTPSIVRPDIEEKRVALEDAKRRPMMEADGNAKKAAQEQRVAVKKKLEEENERVRIQENDRFRKEIEENNRRRLEDEERMRLRKEAEEMWDVAQAEVNMEHAYELKEGQLGQREDQNERRQVENEQSQKVAEKTKNATGAEAKRELAERERKEQLRRPEEVERTRLAAQETEHLYQETEKTEVEAPKPEVNREEQAHKLGDEHSPRVAGNNKRKRLEDQGDNLLQKAAEERETTETQARRSREEPGRRLQEVHLRKVDGEIGKDLDRDVRRPAEHKVKREKEGVRVTKKPERAKKDAEEKAKKIAMAKAKLKRIADKQKEERKRARARKEEAEESERLRRMKDELVKKEEDERMRNAEEEEIKATKADRTKKEEDAKAAADKEQPDKHTSSGTNSTDSSNSADSRKKRYGPFDRFASENDSSPASFLSALPATSDPDGIKTQGTTDPKDLHFKYDPDFLQIMLNPIPPTETPIDFPLVATSIDEHPNRPAIYFNKPPPGVSHETNPIEWIRLNRENVASLIRPLLGQEFAATYKVSKVYPRLTVYTFASIKSNSDLPAQKRELRLSEAQRQLASWNTTDDISALVNHESVRNYLQDCIDEMRGTKDDCDGVYHGMTLDHALRMDANAIAALLLATLQDRVKRRKLVRLQGPEAQSLLNLLQARLGFPLVASLTHLHKSALLKLSQTSGLYPECMMLKGLELIGDSPMYGGSYGDIWKGSFRGQEIAVKILRTFIQSDPTKILKDFSSEAVIWRQLDHPNVLPFYGVFRLGNNKLCTTSPWMHNGTLINFLESAPETKGVPLMLDIAKGLNYLHALKPKIIHGDLKGVNILITKCGRACLADFGLATTKDTMSFAAASSNGATGTLRWLAPELLTIDSENTAWANTTASDVYAYACVCYEIFSGLRPFDDISPDFRVMAAVQRGDRPPRPSNNHSHIRGLDNAVWTIIQQCWAQDPQSRLTAKEIVELVQSLPTLGVDERPSDNFDPSFPSRTLYSNAEHPFSVLPGVTIDD